VTAWPYPRLIAHRGAGTLAPENTLAALDAAVRYGYRAVELDARLSGEGTPVLIHDDTLERTTTGTGPVARARDAVLRALDAGAWHSPALAGEPLPTLREAIRRCLELGLWANIEIKSDRGHEEESGERIARVVQESWRGTPPLLSSFSPAALEAARRVAPGLPRALLLGGFTGGWRAQAERLGCVAIHSAARETSPADIAAVRRAGLAVACYTVNDPDEVKRLFAAGADAIFTDRPDRIPAD
jgi:glycerophosphoryl diester phosphodiesterase